MASLFGHLLNKNHGVAVMDIRSYSLTVAVFEPGVNGTFIVKSRVTKPYAGYAEGELLDVPEFKKVVKEAVLETVRTMPRPIKKFCIGVPGEFLKVVEDLNVMSLGSARRITQRDLDEITRRARPRDTDRYATICGDAVSYTLSDERKMTDPVGEISDLIKAELCFYRVKRSFAETIENLFADSELREFRFDLELVPTVRAEAKYIMSPETRETYSVLFDFGYISSTYSVVYGNGVVYSESFSIGAGHIAYYLTEELGVPYAVAEEFMSKVNLNVFESSSDNVEVYRDDMFYRVPADLLRSKIREAIDIVCETVDECARNSGLTAACGRNIYITGECVNTVRGFCEHLASRLEKNVIEVVPQLPCYDRPEYSSLTSLMNAAAKR
ncbi:MAG: hypothetical protein LUD72_12715 [Bacteroidales bacterium]|nr:hypothetical protein [Bacteroidales bacterium]